MIRHEIVPHLPLVQASISPVAVAPYHSVVTNTWGYWNVTGGAVSSPGLRKHPQTILIDIVASRTGVEIFPEPARSQTSRTLLPFDRTLGMLDLYPEMRLRHRQHRSRAWPQVPYHSTSLGNIDSSGVLPVSYQDPRPRINLCMCWRCNAQKRHQYSRH